MKPADQYARLLDGPLRERPLLRAARQWSEAELQALWFSGAFGREFRTVDGRAVRVVQFGVWNHEAGPDFAEAAVSFGGGEPVRGAIEFDPDVRDWERHGHAQNGAYENVVLHVFLTRPESECFTRTLSHRAVPQVQLSLAALDAEPGPTPDAVPGRCSGPLRALPAERAREVILGAAQFRLRRKAAALHRLAEIHGLDEALFQAIAAALGYKNNKLPFTLLAQRLPLRQLRAAGDDAAALLFGAAGFLPVELSTHDRETRDYLRGLWDRWWPRRTESERLTIPAELWNFSGQRPANHPQRRLAALAAVVRTWGKIRALSGPGAVIEHFGALTDEYWDRHYTVTSKPAAKPMALVGETRAAELLANVFFPLWSAADARWDEYVKLRAPLGSRTVDIAVQRLFGGVLPDAAWAGLAAMQQGLLQIYEDFCRRDASDCAQCLFPSQLARWNA